VQLSPVRDTVLGHQLPYASKNTVNAALFVGVHQTLLVMDFQMTNSIVAHGRKLSELSKLTSRPKL
jgi:hypothetical protein